MYHPLRYLLFLLLSLLPDLDLLFPFLLLLSQSDYYSLCVYYMYKIKPNSQIEVVTIINERGSFFVVNTVWIDKIYLKIQKEGESKASRSKIERSIVCHNGTMASVMWLFNFAFIYFVHTYSYFSTEIYKLLFTHHFCVRCLLSQTFLISYSIQF